MGAMAYIGKVVTIVGHIVSVSAGNTQYGFSIYMIVKVDSIKLKNPPGTGAFTLAVAP